jgi:hypothetical protein
VEDSGYGRKSSTPVQPASNSPRQKCAELSVYRKEGFMSVQTGWFVIVNEHSKVRETVAYRCQSCSVEYFFLGDEEGPRAFCCGQWKAKPVEGWFSKLPRVKAQPARGAMLVLPSSY